MKGALSCLALVLVLAGCGGGSSTTGAGQGFVRGELTKSEWIGRADSYCRNTAEAIDPLRNRLGSYLGRGNLEMAGVKTRTIVYELEKNGERLRRLGVPKEGSRKAHEFESKLERTIEQEIDLAEALEAEESSTAARLQSQIRATQSRGLALAHELGLQVCGTE